MMDEQKLEGGDLTSGNSSEREHSHDPPPVLHDATSMGIVREAVLVAVVSMAQFATQVGVGQTIAILHVIGHDLGIEDPATLSWLMASYSLTVGTFILPSGRLGDLFGYKKLYIIGLIWFAVWSMVAGLSVYSGKVLFIFARALQGIGPAICLPNGLAILGDSYPAGRRKSLVFSIFGATAPLGSVVGATFASLFAEAWWPWAFFSFALVLVATAAFAMAFVPTCSSSGRQQGTMYELFTRIHPMGSATGVLSLVLINFAWNQAPVVGWREPYVPVALVLGLLLAPTFFYVEARVATYPLIPAGSISSDIGMILACIGCGWSCFGIFLYYIWQFFELLRVASPLLASAWYSTNAISGAVAAILTGIFLDRVGPPLAMVLALLAFVVGSIFIATAPVDQTYWANSFLCLLIIPFGMDISFPAATVIISNQAPRDKQGIGASLVNTVVNWSISMGLGIAGTVETEVNHGGYTRSDLLLGFRGSWYTGIGLSGLGQVISIIFWTRQLRAKRREADPKSAHQSLYNTCY